MIERKTVAPWFFEVLLYRPQRIGRALERNARIYAKKISMLSSDFRRPGFRARGFFAKDVLR
jgi:hypothetical protein